MKVYMYPTRSQRLKKVGDGDPYVNMHFIYDNHVSHGVIFMHLVPGE